MMPEQSPKPNSVQGNAWQRRVGRALLDCDAICRQPSDEKVARRVTEFAADEKWEVRKVVAEALATMPETLYRELAAGLCGDSNAFVRAAAERSVDKRNPVSVMVEGTTGKIQQAFERIAAKHGPEAAHDAIEFAHQVTERHIRSAVHDIRNILPSLSLDAESFEKTGAKLKRKLERVQRGCAYLKNLAEMMSKYSEPLDFAVVPEPLAEIVRAAFASAVGQIESDGRSVDGVVLSDGGIPEAVMVPVSRYHIEMVLTNLVKNGILAHAVSATEMKPGYVRVEAAIDGGEVVVSVRDGGRGISPTDLAKLREFIPGGSSRRRDKSGTGYGLPICRRYVEAHGGSLKIESNEKEGTTVAFRLPLDTSNGRL